MTGLEIFTAGDALSNAKDRSVRDVEQASSVAFHVQLGDKSRWGSQTARFQNSITMGRSELDEMNDRSCATEARFKPWENGGLRYQSDAVWPLELTDRLRLPKMDSPGFEPGASPMPRE
jgi:hypothetical protein